MPYRSSLSCSAEVASSSGDVTGKVSITPLEQDVDFVNSFNTICLSGSPAPIKQFTLNFNRLRFLILKASAPVEISLTQDGSNQDIWFPLPARSLHLAATAGETIIISQLKLRLNASASTVTPPPTEATVEVLLGGISA